MLRAIIPLFTFALRHFLAVAFCIVAGCVLWTVAYIVLFIVAMIGNYGVGGPLAYPGGIVAVLVACAIIGWGIFAPASAAGAIACAALRLPKFAAIPVVFISAFLISHILCCAWFRFATTHSMPPTWDVLKNFTLFLSVPLGMYWWLTEGPGAIVDATRRYLQNCSLKPEHTQSASSSLPPLP